MPDDVPDMRSEKIRLRWRQPLNDVSSVSSTSMPKPKGCESRKVLSFYSIDCFGMAIDGS